MIYAAAIGFLAVFIIALIFIHRDNQRILKHHQDFLQQQLNRLNKITKS